MPTSTSTVNLTVARFGNFGDRMQITATVDGIAPSRDRVGEILSVSYRDRTVAWVEMPTGADSAAVIAEVQRRADYLLGSRCPEMGRFPLSFS
jgi:hypothetical protein